MAESVSATLDTAATSRGWLGAALMAFSATCYGIIPIFARFAYEGGSTPLALLAFRYVLVAAALLLLARLQGRPIGLGKGQQLAGVAFAVIFALASWGYFGAVRYLPVSLAVLIFFTHPAVVVLITRLRGGPRLGAARAASVALAFTGLALGLGVSPRGFGGAALDLRGLAFGALSTAGYAAMLLFGGHVVRRSDAMALNLHTMLISALICVPAALLLDQLALPTTALAWFGAAGVVLLFLLGVVSFFAALSRIGPVRTAMLSHIEPVVSILGAVLILGESLTALQAIGIALVLGAITIMARPPA